MSKTKLIGLAYNEATPELIALAQSAVNEAAKHRYSVSRIYTVYNAITGKAEEPQTCSSCLRARAREIKKWLDEGTAAVAKVSKGKEPAKGATDAGKLLGVNAGPGVTADKDLLDEPDTPTKDELIQGWAERVTALGLTGKSTAEEITAAHDALILADGTSPEAAEYFEYSKQLYLGALADAEPDFEVIKLENGLEVLFTINGGGALEDGSKGTVKTVEGGSMKAGTYKTTDGGELRIQVGGKATYLEAFDDLAS